MDNSHYKEIKVDRGFNYRYYFSPPTDGKPILLFLHGFPSTSHDWVRQIEHFQPRGYGIVAPDMLGSGGTSRPLDVNAFHAKLIAKDIIDILNNENIDMVVGVGHDWCALGLCNNFAPSTHQPLPRGCAALSRLSILYPDRFIAYGWLALSFMAPLKIKFDLKEQMDIWKRTLGRESLAYWEFFNREDASAIIEKNIDSFIQLLYPKNPECWDPYMVVPGKTAEWMENDMKPGFPDHLRKDDVDVIREGILDGGIGSGLNYYKARIQNIDLEDNLNLTGDYMIEKPCFFAAVQKDYVCTPVVYKSLMEKYAKDLTIIDCDTGHWLQFEASDQINTDLEAWLRSKVNLS